jgi:beta-carotene 15,15'-dioxygenase
MNPSHQIKSQSLDSFKSGYFIPLSGLTLLIALPYVLGFAPPEWLELTVFAFFVIITGIPHGAVDHIVAANVYKLDQSFGDQLRFYATYLVTMLLLGLVWVISPFAGFLIFMVISVYHFGQGDLAYFATLLPKWQQVALYASRGLFLITLPIALHLEITAPIIESAAGINLMQIPLFADFAVLTAMVVTAIHVLVLLGVWVLRDKSSSQPLFLAKECISIGILGLLFVYAHPLVGFGVYFGLWHGLNHFFELKEHLSSSNEKYTIAQIYSKTIPFTLLSIVGLALLWLLSGAFGLQNRMISLLFILISVLTLPHMLLIDKMYAKKREIG